MPSIYQLKSSFQSFLRPFTNTLARWGVTANQVTLFAMLISMAQGLALFLFVGEKWPLIMVPIVMFVRMALNAVDGMLAREHNMETPLGAILNEMGDVVSDIFLYLPFVFIFPQSVGLIIAIVIVSVVTEMMGVVSVQVGGARRFDGPMGKSDRAFVFGAVSFFLYFDLFNPLVETYLFPIVLGLSVVTVLNRARAALKDVNQSKTVESL